MDYTQNIEQQAHNTTHAQDLNIAKEDGYATKLGSDTTSYDAGEYVVYMEGLPTKVCGLTKGKRLYGGSFAFESIRPDMISMDGNLLISGKDIELDWIYGGGYLYTGSVPAGEFNSRVEIEAGASFDSSRTIFLLGGSHVNNSSTDTTTTTVNANSTLIVDANVTNAGFVCGGHGCYTTAEITGNSSLSISAGTYGEDVLVAGGSVLYINSDNDATLTQNGNTSLTITGGTFTENVYGGNIFLYASEEAMSDKNEDVITLKGTSQITIDCTGGKAITIESNIFAGSNGRNTVESTKVLFKGSKDENIDDGAKLSIAGYVSGDSSGRHGKMGTEDYVHFAGSDSREIIFENFHGTLGGATALYDFDKFTFENSEIDLGSAALNSINETWNFSNGSSVTWDTELNFSGDAMILGDLGESISEKWTVFAGLNSVDNFANMASVKIFDEIADKDTDTNGNTIWKTDSYKLAVSEETENGVTTYSLVVSLA